VYICMISASLGIYEAWRGGGEGSGDGMVSKPSTTSSGAVRGVAEEPLLDAKRETRFQSSTHRRICASLSSS
jgi:hypothetical protein